MAGNLVFAEAINPDITNVAGNQITFSTAHNFLTGDYVEYDANGDAEIVGLLNEVKYYVSVPSPTSIILYHDADFGKPVRSLDPSVCTGTHYFRKGDEYIYVEEVLETHNTYQDWIMPETEGGQTVNYGIIVGNFFTATNTNGKVVNAAVAAWDFDTKTLTVSIEYVLYFANCETKLQARRASISPCDASVVNAPTIRLSPARTAVVSKNCRCTVGLPRRMDALSKQGKSSWTKLAQCMNSSAAAAASVIVG